MLERWIRWCTERCSKQSTAITYLFIIAAFRHCFAALRWRIWSLCQSQDTSFCRIFKYSGNISGFNGCFKIHQESSRYLQVIWGFAIIEDCWIFLRGVTGIKKVFSSVPSFVDMAKSQITPARKSFQKKNYCAKSFDVKLNEEHDLTTFHGCQALLTLLLS